MGKKRSIVEMQADVKRLLKASETATTMAELTKVTGMPYAKISRTFSKYPDAYEKLKKQLATNLANSKSKAKSEAAAVAIEEPLNVSLEPKPETSAITAKSAEAIQHVDQDEEPEFTCGFVVDASIMQLADADIFLDRLLVTEAKIILTSITLKELDKMQSFEDEQAIHTKYFLARAAREPNLFICVQIDETLGIPDDCIIAYCRQYRNKVTLLTADKMMALKARTYPRPVQVQYFSASDSLDEGKNNSNNRNVRTLIPAKLYNGKLQIFNFETHTQSICAISNGKQYFSGPFELHIGDDILIATQKSTYITFAHYHLISLNEKDNCELILSKRLPLDGSFSFMNPVYSSFLKRFMETHNL